VSKGVGDGDRRCRAAVVQDGEVEVQGRQRQSPLPRARRRVGRVQGPPSGARVSSWNGVWLSVAKKRYFRPLRLLGEAAAGARWRVVELALGLRLGVARRSAPAAADRRARASAPRSQFGRTCFEGGVGDGDRRRREAVDEEGGVGAQARRRRSPRPGARRRAGGLFKNRLRGHVGSSWNGVWLSVVKMRYFRPLRRLDEATAGARLRVDELALG